jgi:hypothetical protein
LHAHEKEQRLWNLGKRLVIIGLISFALGYFGVVTTPIPPCAVGPNGCSPIPVILSEVFATMVLAGIALIIIGVGLMIASRLLKLVENGSSHASGPSLGSSLSGVR